MVPLIPGESVSLPRYPRRLDIAPVPSEPVTVKPGRQSEPGGQKGEQAAKALEGGAPPGGGAAPERAPSSAGEGRPGLRGGTGTSAPPGYGFQLIYPKSSALNLSKPAENSVDDLLRPDRYRSWQGIDFSKYVGPPGASAAAGGAPPKAGRGGAPAGPPRGTRVVPNIVRYDFTPWANEIVNRIQTRWSLGQEAFVGYVGEVGVNVMITKGGELLASDVRASSKIDLLDQTALQAVRASAPFPPLPADFPNSTLEFYLVFQYGY